MSECLSLYLFVLTYLKNEMIVNNLMHIDAVQCAKLVKTPMSKSKHQLLQIVRSLKNVAIFCDVFVLGFQVVM